MLEPGPFVVGLLKLPQPVTTLAVGIAAGSLALKLNHPIQVSPQLFRVCECPADGLEGLRFYRLGSEVLSHTTCLWPIGGSVGAAVVVASTLCSAYRHAAEGAPAAAATEDASRKLPGSLRGLGCPSVVLHGCSCNFYEFAGYAGVGHRDTDPLILRDPHALLALPVAAGTVRRGLGGLLFNVGLGPQPPNNPPPLFV